MHEGFEAVRKNGPASGINPDEHRAAEPLAGWPVTMILVAEDLIRAQPVDRLQDEGAIMLVAADTRVIAMPAASGRPPPRARAARPQKAESAETRLRTIPSSETRGTADPELIRFHRLEIDTEKRHVRCHGRSVSVTPQEFSLLALLAKRAGRAFSFRELFSHVWTGEQGFDPSVAHSAVRRLRRKLGSAGSDVTIESVRGYGFRLVQASHPAACQYT
jgi:two-component system response regulator MtrA